ncbi:hypothetical protein RRG50_03670 [Mycoplasmopsis felis]|uniref:MAG1430 family protein n=1 Tax=Mycoplasmopsis felis TaxID=33923 RepID=UPI002AFE9B7B|nr:hypothetical protein [Mycoplasmopsis felis]WQQ07223.1 hypothetical protein RRG37_01215 [Mycoplasmopsis felis]WQQ11113.1 hypothetical protein RRG45_01230 [Mycoplasmopsis felis]
MKNKFIYLLFSIFFSAFSITLTSIILLYNYKKITNNEIKNDEKKEFEYNGLKLSDFNFYTGKINKENELASGYSQNPIFKSNSNNINNEYWKKELILKELRTQEQLNKNDFYLISNNGAPINIFLPDYNISFSSYANDITGILYLKINLAPKVINKEKTEHEYIYEISGFRTININDLEPTMFINRLDTDTSAISKYKTIENMKNEYFLVSNDAIQKENFIRNIFPRILVSITSKINYEKTFLDFNNNEIILNAYLEPVVNQAHKNDLILRTQVSNSDNFFSIVSRKIKFS